MKDIWRVTIYQKGKRFAILFYGDEEEVQNFIDSQSGICTYERLSKFF